MRNTLLSVGKACVGGLAAALLLAGCGSNDRRELVSIEIEPAAPQVAAGTATQLTATGIYDNGSKSALTGQVQWSTGNAEVATIGTTGDQAGRLQGVAEGLTSVTARLGDISAIVTARVTPAVPVSLALSPATTSVAQGATVQIAATATFSDDTTQDVTTDAVWSSLDAAVASVGNSGAGKGRVQGQAQGVTGIRAAYQGLEATAGITVTAAQIVRVELTPASPNVPKGTTRALTATAVYSNDTTQDVTAQAAWTSASPAIASVSDAEPTRGVVSGLEPGSATVTASFGGVSGSTVVQVTSAIVTGLEVTPATATLAKGTQQAFVAVALFSDGSTQEVTADAVWSSSVPAVATISNAAGSSGRATAVAEGATVITAAYQAQSATADLTVTAAVLDRIEVTPANASLPVGRTQQYTATGVFSDGSTQDVTAQAAWSSADSGIAAVGNADGTRGLVSGQTAGSTTINAAYQGLGGATPITVTDAVVTAIQVSPANQKLAKTFKRPFTATGLFSDNSNRDVTTQVVWSTSDNTIATISNAAGSQGLATGVTAGPVQVTASLDGVSGSVLLTVTDATLTAIGVTPASKTLPKGLSEQFQADGTFSDGSTQNLTTQVIWQSADAAVATVSNAPGEQGKVIAREPGGPVTVSASVGGIQGTASVTVSAAALASIAITPSSVSVPKGAPQTFTARGTYTDGSTAGITDSVTWSSSDTAVATISNAAGSKGRAQAVGEGQTTITAAQGSVTGTAALTVTEAVLVSLAVTPSNPSIAKGRTRQFTATGTYSDNSTRNLTAEVQWTSSQPTIATISNAAADAGLATGVAAGTAEITATMPGVGISDSTELTVTDAVVDTVAILPATPSVPKGGSLQLAAQATYSDGSIADLTTSVTWSSSNSDIATVSNGAGSKGLAFGKLVGSVTVTALHPDSGKSGTATLQVTAAQLVAIALSPESGARVPVGFAVAFSAQGQYGDGSTRDLTAEVSWSVLDPAIASIANEGSRKGEARGQAPGSTRVFAALDGVTGSAPLTVSGAVLQSIAVTPANDSFGPNETKQYTATGTFDDSSTLVITREVTWESSNTAVATISNAEGSKGLATAGNLPGTTVISAKLNDVTGSTNLTRNLF